MNVCPSREQLGRLLAEELGGAEAEAVEAHVQSCGRCQDSLADLCGDTLAPAGPGQADLTPEPPAEFVCRLKQAVLDTPSLCEPFPGEPAGTEQGDYPRVPGYEIQRVLGRGGMGVVYLARQVRLDRLVALKMILAGAHAGPHERARFKAEAEAVARLQHPHIVQVFEAGEDNGCPYLVLEYVPGGSLTDRAKDGPWAPRVAAEFVRALARAVQAAHEQGVVHRDLKPANVLLAADGTPKVTDFGLAKRLDAQRQTQSGAVVGTPSYMAPEQAAGSGKGVGPAADVYALGAILYELLTGRPPFKAVTDLDTMLQVISQEPVAVRRLQPNVPRDLDLVCLKCLQKEPARRYANASALAEELGRYLHGKPLALTRPVGQAERLWRWARRNPALAALAFAVWLLALGVAAVSSVSYFRLTAANEQERASRIRAEQNLQVARDAVAYFTRLSEDPRLKPRGLEGLQRDMWRQVKGFYEQLGRQQSEDPRVEAERGLTHVRLGRVSALLGSADEALAAQVQARGVFERLIREHGDTPQYEDGLVQALLELGTLHQLREDWTAADEALGKALAIGRRLVGEHAEDFAFRARLSLAYFQLGRLHQLKKEPGPARDYYELALATYEPLKSQKPQEGLGPAVLARAHLNLGTVYAMPGLSSLPGNVSNQQRARMHYAEALRTLGDLDRQYPGVPEYQGVMAETHYLLGVLHRAGKQYEQAREQFGKAMVLAERLQDGHKDVLDYPFRLSRYQHAQGLNFVLQLRLDEGRVAYDQAAAVLEPLARQHPSPDYQRELSALLFDRACLEALAASAASKETGVARPHRQAQHEHCCRAAIDHLRQAWTAGFKDYPGAIKLIRTDENDLSALRGRDDFKRLLDELEKDRPKGK
jgi:tetratricopeptide (TPR) repeat protein